MPWGIFNEETDVIPSRLGFAAVLIACGGLCLPAAAEDRLTPEQAQAPQGVAGDETHPLAEQTLTRDLFGFGQTLRENGIHLALGLTQIYQLNTHGGLATHRHAGRYTGSYDLELEVDLGRLMNWQGGTVYALGEGGFSDGLDASSIGSAVGNVNGDAMGDEEIRLSELWYQHDFLDGRLRFRAGKLDLTVGFEHAGHPVGFDTNRYANDENAAFLNAALVNNPTVPFPDYGLGAMALFAPTDWWYVTVGAGDAEADPRATGFGTAFHDTPHFAAFLETGLVGDLPLGRPLPGAYRVGTWMDPSAKDRHAGTGRVHHDMGVYLSFDQAVYKENDDPHDGQGIGLCFRYGFAHADVNEVSHFYSVGGLWEGLLPTRDADVLGLAFATGKLVKAAGFDDRHETALECFYNAEVLPWLHVTPNVQYVVNPGGTAGVDNAVILGLRAHMAF